MAIINYFKKEIHVKIVYCGPGLSGKTTNLQWLNQHLREGKVGKLISLATKTDRTLFFDLMAVHLGKVRGFETRIQLFTTPGQVFYNATRKLVLKGVDGIVFVADSQTPMRAANIESLKNLEKNLQDYNRSLDEIPLVMQYNKRDLPSVMSVEEMENDLNPKSLPYFESCAVSGKGIKETFESISKLSFKSIQKLENLSPDSGTKSPSAPAPAAKPAPPPDPKAQSNVLKIIRCLPPKILEDGTIQIPLDVYHAKNDEDMRIQLEIKLMIDEKTGKPSVVINP